MKALVPDAANGGWIPSVHLGDNSTGFSALPAGWVGSDGGYRTTAIDPSSGQIAFFHMDSPTQDYSGITAGPSFFDIYQNSSAINIEASASLKDGFSVRFVDNYSVTRTYIGNPNTDTPCIVTWSSLNHGNREEAILYGDGVATITAASDCTINTWCQQI